MSLKNFKQINKSILINLLFLFIFCYAPYSALHAQPISPRDFSKATDTPTDPITGPAYYISNSGNDNADGRTPETAWRTVNKVNRSSFSPGDYILFNRGDTWNEQLVVPSSGSAAGGDITFGAYGSGDLPVFDGTGVTINTNYRGLINTMSKDYITIEYIRVVDTTDTGGTGDEISGINFYDSDHCTISHCETYNTEASGLRGQNSDYLTIEYSEVDLACTDSMSESISIENDGWFEVHHNIISNGGTTTGGGAGIDAKNGSHDGTIHHNEVFNYLRVNGIYVDAWNQDTYNIEIYSNYIHDAQGSGFQIGAETGGHVYNISIHHNIVSNCLQGGFSMHDVGPGPVTEIYIYNNTFSYNGTEGNQWYGNFRAYNRLIDDLYIKNNIFYQGYNFQIGFETDANIPASAYTIDYNVIYGDQDASWWTTPDGTNAITSDPLFVGADDFHLQSTSPVKNACDNSVWQGTPNITDFDGVPITNEAGNIVVPGGRVSCGAYE